MRGIVWFKKDLRLLDNPALHQACRQCEDGVAAVYVIDYQMWKDNDTANCQIEFIFRGLALLKSNLAELGIPLLILETDKTKQCPAMIAHVFDQVRAEKIFFNRELEVNEHLRDQAVVKYLVKKGISSVILDDQLIIAPAQFYSEDRKPFKVFTAFKRYWIKQYSSLSDTRALAKPKLKNKLKIKSSPLPRLRKAFHSPIEAKLWPAGEQAAQKLLRRFIEKNLLPYQQRRDFPGLEGTSKLSPYLATGMISARTCFVAALKENHFELDSGHPGALTWMSELIWREFYRHVLMAEPRVCMNKAYKPETEKLPWLYDKKLLQAWQNGKTGFPIVDAAMRQLNSLGWMHNRLRMIVAMFLAKNLFLDWRLGEQYFSRHLIDIDFASNNGGWQWSASTGTDSVPYFRIFNPTTQSQRFDAEGDFIREYCPELEKLDSKAIHAPWVYAPLLAKKAGYPQPIIDYAKSRKCFIETFKQSAKK